MLFHPDVVPLFISNAPLCVLTFLMTPYDLDEHHDLHFTERKGRSLRWQVVIIIIMANKPLPWCTCYMLGNISPEKKKCNRNWGLGWLWREEHRVPETRTGAEEQAGSEEQAGNPKLLSLSVTPPFPETLVYSQTFSAELIFVVTSYYGRFSCSQYPWHSMIIFIKPASVPLLVICHWHKKMFH